MFYEIRNAETVKQDKFSKTEAQFLCFAKGITVCINIYPTKLYRNI